MKTPRTLLAEALRDSGLTFFDAEGEVADAALTASPELEAALALGIAWVAVEAVLPEDHILAGVRMFDDGTEWSAATDNISDPPVGRYHYSATGPTPTAALLALKDALTGREEVG